MKKLASIFIINISIIFILLEISLFFFSNKINSNFLFYLPSTQLKTNLLIKKNMRGPEQRANSLKRNFIKNEFSKKLSAPIETIYRKPDVQDIKYGAVNYFFYNNGFCNKDYNKNSLNIVSFGDSFTYCTFVKPDETWSKKLKGINNNLSSLNYGMTGIGLYEQYRLMKEIVDKNDKIIISAIYEGNDLRDSIKHLNYIKTSNSNSNKINKKDINENFLKKILKKIFSKSYTFNFAAGTKNFLILKKKDKHNLNFRYKYLNSNIEFNINNIDQDEIRIAKKIYYNDISKDYIKEAFMEPIMKIKNLAYNNGSILIFIYIPSAHNVIKDDIIFESENSKKYLEAMSKIQLKVFDEICKSQNLNCFDTTKDLYKYNKRVNELTHFPSNLHLTSIGHQVVGESVGKYLYTLMKKNEKK
jgi:hypothetical protein